MADLSPAHMQARTILRQLVDRVGAIYPPNSSEIYLRLLPLLPLLLLSYQQTKRVQCRVVFACRSIVATGDHVTSWFLSLATITAFHPFVVRLPDLLDSHFFSGLLSLALLFCSFYIISQSQATQRN